MNNKQSNTELIQAVYAAFGRGDVQTILDSLAADVQWILQGPSIIPYAGHKTGPAEVAQFFTALATTQQNHRLTIDEYIAEGDNVITLGRYAALVTSTGKQIDCATAHVFTVRDGKIVRFLDFVDTAQMADAYVPVGKSVAVS